MIVDLNNQWVNIKMYMDNMMYNRARLIPYICENFSIKYKFCSSLSDYVYTISSKDVVEFIFKYIHKFNGYIIDMTIMRNFECVTRIKEVNPNKIYQAVKNFYHENEQYFYEKYVKSAIKIQKAYNNWKWRMKILWNTNNEIGKNHFYITNYILFKNDSNNIVKRTILL